MHVTAKADYAVRAVVELASGSSDSPRKVDEVAQAQGIPVSFLENILTQLRSAGLVRSQRGPEGGYWLAHPPGGGQPRAGHPRGRGAARGRARAAPRGDRLRGLGRVAASRCGWRCARTCAKSSSTSRSRTSPRASCRRRSWRSPNKRKPGKRVEGTSPHAARSSGPHVALTRPRTCTGSPTAHAPSVDGSYTTRHAALHARPHPNLTS